MVGFPSRLPRAPRFWTRVSRTFCLLFVAFVLLLSACGFLVLATGLAVPAGAADNPPTPPNQAQVDALKAEVRDLSEQAETLKQREEDLKWVLGFILGAAALFALAQGVSAWFSAESFNKQAEQSLKKANSAAKKIEKRATELQEKYPLFSEEERRRKQAFDDLERIFKEASPVQKPDEGFNWQRNYYTKMPLLERQKLLSTERFISYEIAGKKDPDDVYARRLRRLALFYWSKFIYERKHGSGNYSDIDHAEYLINLAIERIGRAFYLLNDLGNIYIERHRAFADAIPVAQSNGASAAQLKGILDQAKEEFLGSIEAQKNQLRAYFNLSFIFMLDAKSALKINLREDAIRNLRDAIKYLRAGLKYPNWENEPVIEYCGSAIYNLACCYARLFKLYEHKPQWSKAAVKACETVLRKAARIGMSSPDDVKTDFDTEDGDFFPIVHNATPEVKIRFEALKTALLGASGKK